MFYSGKPAKLNHFKLQAQLINTNNLDTRYLLTEMAN